MDREIKILFMSDIHLGIRPNDTHIPDYARINTFKRIAAIARGHDLFLIGGDLIDNASVGSDIIDIIKTEFRALRNAGTEIAYTPGKGELTGRNVIAPAVLDLNASCLFSSSMTATPYLYMKNGQKVYVYGLSGSLGYDLSKVKKISEEGFHIGLFHADFDFDNEKNDYLVYRLQKNDIKTLGLDFYAFGYCHSFKMFKIMDRIIGVCPGSPEATTFDETGDRYIISIVIKENRLYQIKRLTVNSMKLCRNQVDCSSLVTMGPIKELLENNRSKKAIQQVVLTGERDFVLRQYEIQNYRNEFFRLDFVDRSVPTIGSLIEEFQYENSLRGEFYKIIKEQIEQGGLPHDVDKADFAMSLNKITREGFTNLEDWLCSI
ncbi:MAG TPA: metallophosphoesterase [Spirochaetota bacterium]|nr:metallophosphoesterase [Spirochaetota bacterium]HPC39828.1 metallophosphoesterase [Spirochaetota bacterium]HPL16306.1 metallophosphoesterase [Spirochaetota bacterium]HQF09875.1 metallophosphoesterase [Spirochaetota bacterium]HQH98525.1 metallophosphoesterase [Spirochaetota bacterium]